MTPKPHRLAFCPECKREFTTARATQSTCGAQRCVKAWKARHKRAKVSTSVRCLRLSDCYLPGHDYERANVLKDVRAGYVKAEDFLP